MLTIKSNNESFFFWWILVVFYEWRRDSPTLFEEIQLEPSKFMSDCCWRVLQFLLLSFQALWNIFSVREIKSLVSFQGQWKFLVTNHYCSSLIQSRPLSCRILNVETRIFHIHMSQPRTEMIFDLFVGKFYFSCRTHDDSRVITMKWWWEQTTELIKQFELHNSDTSLLLKPLNSFSEFWEM